MFKKNIFHLFGLYPIHNKTDLNTAFCHLQQRGVLNRTESSMMHRCLNIHKIAVEDIIIDKANVKTIASSATISQVIKEYEVSQHSRYPVIDVDGNILGLILIKDLLQSSLLDTPKHPIKNIIRPAAYTTHFQQAITLLHDLQRAHKHMSIVLDEYGVYQGIVTIEDLLEQIVGEIEDEHDTTNPEYITPLSSNKYLVNGITPIEQFNQYFDTQIDMSEFDTIAGVVTKEFGHIPINGESVTIGGLVFIVKKASATNIQLLEINSQ
tara:strand:- start:481 stop:1278 length:798 start_codon:yes stop_codon:yes gene_type:complete